MLREGSWSRSNFFWGTFRCRRPNATWAASGEFDPPSMIGLASSRILESGARLWKVCRQYVRNVNSAWGACTPAPLPASRRSTHFQPLGILKGPHATTACGAPALARGGRIKRRIIWCAQLGSRKYERTRTNPEAYYQQTGAKTQ